jgi:hypothetical protein
MQAAGIDRLQLACLISLVVRWQRSGSSITTTSSRSVLVYTWHSNGVISSIVVNLS